MYLLRQVVIVDAATLRCASSDTSVSEPCCFAEDAPGQVPLARWDTESAAACHLDGALPARFASFMPGVPTPQSSHPLVSLHALMHELDRTVC